MKVLITGGTGFVGVHLATHFIGRGDRVVALGTSARHPLSGQADFEYISADTTEAGEWQERVAQADTVINLAGRNIFKYWTESYKQQIYASRIRTTQRLVEGMGPGGPVVFLSTSAIGYYGDRGEEPLTEDVPPGDDFLAGVCIDWEKEALAAASKGVRTAVMRFGVILGPGGGALSKMIPAYRFFAGGPLASGDQWFPWLHIDDLSAAVDFIGRNDTLAGIFNFCSPRPVRNREFAKILGRVLRRPALMKTPGLAIRLLMGEMGGALLSSQKGIPKRLEDSGFEFRYPDLEKALTQIVG